MYVSTVVPRLTPGFLMHTFTAGMGSKSLQPFSGFVCPGLSLWVVEKLRRTKHEQSLFSTLKL